MADTRTQSRRRFKIANRFLAHIFPICVLISLCFTSACQNSQPVGSPTLKRFEFSKQCPHICWLGINPGKTTATQAKILLAFSNQIDPKGSQVDDNGINTTWIVDKHENYSSTVGIQFEDGLVKTIYLTSLPYTIDDFVKQLGEPDKIRIRMQEAERDFIMYAIYFPSRKVIITAFTSPLTGPDPADFNLTLVLNADFNNDNLSTDWGEIQPWLGYGHLNDYLPGVHCQHC